MVGWREYYAERDTRTPVWTCAGDARAAAALVGLEDTARAGGDADPDVVARWLDAGVAPIGECGRALGKGGVHGFDLTFCAPKSVSLVRALRGEEMIDKAVSAAHQTAITEALEYLAATCRIHPGAQPDHRGKRPIQKLPGLVAAAYQHETSRAGDPHLHTHVLVPNRQARADGRLVSIDGTSLYPRSPRGGHRLPSHAAARIASPGWGGVGAGRPVDGDGRDRRHSTRTASRRGHGAPPSYGSGPRRILTVVDAGEGAHAGAVGGRAESHQPA